MKVRTRSTLGRQARRAGLGACALLCFAGAALAADDGLLANDDTVAEADAQIEGARQAISEAESASSEESMLAQPGPRAATNRPPASTASQQPYPRLRVPKQGWHYETSYFFMLTHGLDEEPITEDWILWSARVGTVIVDVFTLPGAALAGLFGP